MIDDYNNLIEAFSNLNKDKKRKEILEEIQEVLFIFHTLCKEKDENNKLLTNYRMLELNEKEMNEEEFLNALYAYIVSMKDVIGKYFELYK